jgi:histidine triad (HIT) family protein
MTDCIFCKIIAGELPADKVYEDNDFVAFLDIHPVNLGHTLLVPKTHYDNLLDLPAEITEKIGSVTQKLARAVWVGAGASGLNLGMNNGADAGQLVPHAHLHIIPRFEGDGLHHWPHREVTKDDLQATADKIKQELK